MPRRRRRLRRRRRRLRKRAVERRHTFQARGIPARATGLRPVITGIQTVGSTGPSTLRLKLIGKNLSSIKTIVGLANYLIAIGDTNRKKQDNLGLKMVARTDSQITVDMNHAGVNYIKIDKIVHHDGSSIQTAMKMPIFFNFQK